MQAIRDEREKLLVDLDKLDTDLKVAATSSAQL
jgi:hypothetical protein